MNNYVLCMLSFILGGTSTFLVKRFAPSFGLLDTPNDRSSHIEPTPKGGGIGIFLSFLLASLFFGISPLFWVPATLLALLSFFSDIFELSARLRLAFQFLAAVIFLFGIGHLDPKQANQMILAILLAVFVVGTANIYNFMDGIDGIAAITGIIGFGLLALVSLVREGEEHFAVLSICIALSCLGFLPFNLPKAKVFMGDVGSVLLGFVFSGMVVMLSKSLLDFICLASFLFPFYADELTTMFVRIKDGENLLHAHRRHVYQILANEKRMAHWKVAAGYGFLQLVVGLSVLFLKPFGMVTIISLLGLYFALFVSVSSVVRRSVTSSASTKYARRRPQGAGGGV